MPYRVRLPVAFSVVINEIVVVLVKVNSTISSIGNRFLPVKTPERLRYEWNHSAASWLAAIVIVETSLYIIYECFLTTSGKGEIDGTVLVDVSKVVDLVDNKVLTKMSNYNISLAALTWFRLYLIYSCGASLYCSLDSTIGWRAWNFGYNLRKYP